MTKHPAVMPSACTRLNSWLPHLIRELFCFIGIADICGSFFCVRNLFPMFRQCVLADKIELCIRRVGFIAQVRASRACNNSSVRVHAKVVNQPTTTSWLLHGLSCIHHFRMHWSPYCSLMSETLTLTTNGTRR